MSTATANGVATHDDPFAMEVPAPGGNYELPPAGNHAAICFGIVDLGTHDETYQGETKTQLKTCLLFETPEEKQQDGTPHAFGIEFTRSLNEKAKLRKFLETWRGKPFAENEPFSLGSILGKPCLLNVTHSTGKKDKTYANAGAATPLVKGMSVPIQFNTMVTYSLRDITNGVEPPSEEWMPRSYGQKLADIVKDSKEWKAAHGGAAGGAPKSGEVPPKLMLDNNDDSDVPF